MKFHENILNGFQIIERTRLRDERTDRQTDRQPRQKQYISTPVRVRHNDVLVSFLKHNFCFLFTSWRANEAYDFCIGHYFTDLINRAIK